MSRIVLAMSGGVDSSVAAHLLTEAGHDVIGVFMRHGEQSPVACGVEQGAGSRGQGTVTSATLPIVSRLDHKQGCCTAADAEDARRVADKLGIPFYALNLEQEFGQIIDYFVAEYTAGRTPNPCVQCNNWIKFGKLFDYADSVGAEFVATGHYARLEAAPMVGVALVRGVDAAKDQSYVLFGIRRELLPRMMLPVGGFEKPEIRAMAAELGLARRREEGQPGDLLRDAGSVRRVRAAARRWRPRRRDGDERRDGRRPASRDRRVHRRAAEGTGRGARRSEVCGADRARVAAGGDWGSGRVVCARADGTGCKLAGRRPRRRKRRAAALLRADSLQRDGTASDDDACCRNGALHIVFDEPQFAVTPGQAVVCYDAADNRRVLGGGWIE